MSNSNTTARCIHCNEPLSPKHTEPCPNCGRRGKHVSVVINETVTITDTVKRVLTREYEVRHNLWFGLTLVATVSGAVIAGSFDATTGMIISLIFGALSFWFGKRAWTRVKEIDRS